MSRPARAGDGDADVQARPASCRAGASQLAREKIKDKEDLVSAAGFVAQPANTPHRLASMKKLPRNKFVRQANGSDFVYVYADPIVCQCVYVGSQDA